MRLSITVVACRNLPAADVTGTSDPYVLIEGPGSNVVYSTSVVQRSLNPIYNEAFDFDPVPNPYDAVYTFTIMDRDRFDKDDLLGVVKVHLSSLALHNNTSKRVEMKIAGKREGVLVLDFYATNWMEQMAMTVGPVVGLVTHNSARMLVEMSIPTSLVVDVYPISSRDSTLPVSQVLLQTDMNLMGNIPQQQLVFAIKQADKPAVITIPNLQPDMIYRVSFRGLVTNKYAIVKTTPDPLKAIQRNLRFGAVSCNEYHRRELTKDMWQQLSASIDDIDLLMHLGDQIYADHTDSAYEAAVRISAGSSVLTPWQEEAIREAYRKIYRMTWNHPPTSYCLSRVSNLMILDDHEIRDDFGSVPADKDPQSVDHNIGRLSREVYWEYQVALRKDLPMDSVSYTKTMLEPESYYHVVNRTTGIVFLDLRASRSFKPSETRAFLGEEQWNDLRHWMLQGPLSSVQSLIFVCSVPLAFLNKGLTDLFGTYVSKLDDMKDHWAYGKQCLEQIELLQLVEQWKRSAANREVIMLGGDVHIGGVTTVYKDNLPLCQQLITSPISNTCFSWAQSKMLQLMVRGKNQIGAGYAFKHDFWRNDPNYGIIEIQDNGPNTKPNIIPQVITHRGASSLS